MKVHNLNWQERLELQRLNTSLKDLKQEIAEKETQIIELKNKVRIDFISNPENDSEFTEDFEFLVEFSKMNCANCANCDKPIYSKGLECDNMCCITFFCSIRCKEEHMEECHPKD